MSGKIFYGMHFYPGLAQYDRADGESYKIFLNGDTLRKMDPTFAGKPVFVEHVNEISSNREILKNEADGWVIESFYNPNDGKHWAKFIVVTDEGENAIRDGFRLSNAYHPTSLNEISGVWNNIDYEQQVKDGVYEHLAIVKNPRYDESVILTPEEFKLYNQNLKSELEKISNSQQQEKKMGVKDLFFKRTKIENSIDYENTFVCLPKTKKEFSLIQIVNAMDDLEEKKKLNEADVDMNIKLDDGTVMSLKELIERHKNIQAQLEQLLKEKEGSDDDEDLSPDDEIHNEDDEDKSKEDEKNKEKNKKMENSLRKKENIESLKNAHLTHNSNEPDYRLYTTQDKLDLGREFY